MTRFEGIETPHRASTAKHYTFIETMTRFEGIETLLALALHLLLLLIETMTRFEGIETEDCVNYALYLFFN